MSRKALVKELSRKITQAEAVTAARCGCVTIVMKLPVNGAAVEVVNFLPGILTNVCRERRKSKPVKRMASKPAHAPANVLGAVGAPVKSVNRPITDKKVTASLVLRVIRAVKPIRGIMQIVSIR